MTETLINPNQINGTIGGAKALNIAVVGNPTISDDFILSGCSENDYLVHPPIEPRKYSAVINTSIASWKVKMKFRFAQLDSGGNGIITGYIDQQGFRIRTDSNNKLNFLVAANGSWINANDYETNVEYTTPNEWWWLEAGMDSDGHLYINRSLDGENFTNVWKGSYAHSPGYYSWFYLQTIGENSPHLEFDLKEYKFYIADILTYTGVKDEE